MAEPVDQAILALLAEERRILLTGDFGAFADLALRKQALFVRLGSAALSVARLRRVGAQVSRNQRLLSAAQRGLREVMERLAQVRQMRDGFSTYDSQGQKSTVASPKAGFEHKA